MSQSQRHPVDAGMSTDFRADDPCAPVIGNNVVIGANAVVVCDVPDNCVAVGVPALIKRTRTDDATAASSAGPPL